MSEYLENLVMVLAFFGALSLSACWVPWATQHPRRLLISTAIFVEGVLSLAYVVTFG